MITTYQIRNVLRIYGNQLKKRNLSSKENHDIPPQPSEIIDISLEAKRKQMLSHISGKLISQLSLKNTQRRTVEQNPDKVLLTTLFGERKPNES